MLDLLWGSSCPLQSVLVPQLPDVAVPSSRQVCRVQGDEVIGSFTLLSLPSRQEEHLGEWSQVMHVPGPASSPHAILGPLTHPHSHTLTHTSNPLASALKHTHLHTCAPTGHTGFCLFGGTGRSVLELRLPVPLQPRTSSPQDETARPSQPHLLPVLTVQVQEVGGVHAPVHALLVPCDAALDGDPLGGWP